MEDYVDVPESTDEQKSEHALQMRCGHVFGSYCLKLWLKGHNTCPTCRREVGYIEADDDVFIRRRNHHNEMRRQHQQRASEQEMRRVRNYEENLERHAARRRHGSRSVDVTGRTLAQFMAVETETRQIIASRYESNAA
jgi:Ring finger domain